MRRLCEGFPGRTPSGNALGMGADLRIVGVVGNIKSRTLGEVLQPVLYRSLAQDIAADPSLPGTRCLSVRGKLRNDGERSATRDSLARSRACHL